MRGIMGILRKSFATFVHECYLHVEKWADFGLLLAIQLASVFYRHVLQHLQKGSHESSGGQEVQAHGTGKGWKSGRDEDAHGLLGEAAEFGCVLQGAWGPELVKTYVEEEIRSA